MPSRVTSLVYTAATLLLAISSAARGEENPNSLSTGELDQGWIALFDGTTLYGWQPTSKANWKVEDGTIRVSEGDKGFLLTTTEFGDYELKVDFRAPATTNSGVFLASPAEPKDPTKDCYELNIAEPAVSPFFTGSFVGRQKAKSTPYADRWRTFDVTAEAGHFVVKLDGAAVLDYTDPHPLRRGHIGLQFNSGEVAFRNVKLKPLGLKSLFNGKDLSGWTPYPGLPSMFTVNTDGALNIKNGRGQLESQAQFADFTLQLEAISNGKNLNSGVFFRSIPGEIWNGYECQIHNGYKNGDRAQPIDCGTGGFYRRQNARRVVSDDFKWFHETLVAHGPHMAAWVDGIQVSDWTDTRPPDANPRKGLRLDAGTLILQGHDATTDLSFRNFNAVEMPKR